MSPGPILWRSLSSIVADHPSLWPPPSSAPHTRDGLCQATHAQQPERTATVSALLVSAAITSWLFYSTMRASISDEA